MAHPAAFSMFFGFGMGAQWMMNSGCCLQNSTNNGPNTRASASVAAVGKNTSMCAACGSFCAPNAEFTAQDKQQAADRARHRPRQHRQRQARYLTPAKGGQKC
jgi:hypothetical protein